MKNEAILIVSFGTSHEDTLKKTIEAVENKIKSVFPNHIVERAFTSGMIIRSLRGKNIHINTVEEALKTLEQKGITHLLIQPTHLLFGEEYEKMLSIIESHACQFENISVGAPLLDSTEDYRKVMHAISQEYPIGEGEGLVLMGHGTIHHTNSAYSALNYMFKKEVSDKIFVGTVEAYPDINDILDEIKQKGLRHIILAPLMLVAGDHAKNDLAGDDESSWKSILESSGFSVSTVLKGLGEIPAIQELYLHHLTSIS